MIGQPHKFLVFSSYKFILNIYKYFKLHFIYKIFKSRKKKYIYSDTSQWLVGHKHQIFKINSKKLVNLEKNEALF